MVAHSEYQDYKELVDMGIKGETAEKQFEMTFFSVTGIIYFALGIWIYKSRNNNSLIPFIISIIISAVLILLYIASRTIGVPIIGIEYYVGRMDIISKILQVIVIGLSAFGIYNIKKLSKKYIME